MMVFVRQEFVRPFDKKEKIGEHSSIFLILFNIKPNEEVKFLINHEPEPNEIHVKKNNKGNETEVFVENNHFSAPNEKGIYYYDYGVWWMDEKEEHLSHGDANYAFVLEVASDSREDNREVIKNAWAYVIENGWEETASKDWENAKVEKRVVNDDYVLTDKSFLNKEVLVVIFQEAEKVVSGAPTILVDPKTSRVIGYLPTE